MMGIPREGVDAPPADWPPAEEAVHFVQCDTCGGWIDCRDICAAFAHAGPLPHPQADQPQRSGPSRFATGRS
jgi:hypothetical protein